MRTWMDVYRQRQRRERELRFLDQVARNRAAWSPPVEIEDLAYPHGKRSLFEGRVGLTDDTWNDSDST